MVADNGVTGLNIEHSVAEGIVIINLVQAALAYVKDNLGKKLFLDQSQPPASVPQTPSNPQSLSSQD